MNLHGWWSDKQAKIIGQYYIYSTESGEEKKVSQVGSKIEHAPLFEDTVYVGEVNKFVRKEKNF
jgi:hypothetical protein